jgi:hypothetical protein
MNDGENLWVKVPTGYEPFFHPKMLIAVREVSQLRNMTILGYVWEAIEADLAAFRLLRINSKFLQVAGTTPHSSEEKIEVRSHEELTAVRVQKILHLRDQNISTPAIAQRVGCSPMTVHRVLRENAESKVSVPHAAIVSCRAVHDGRPEGSLVGFWPRIESRRKKSA